MKKNVPVALCLVMIVIMFVVFPSPAGCEPPPVPAGLTEWESWVLHGKEKERCPTAYNNAGDVRCRWPSRLSLSIDTKGGRFEQSWLMGAEDWVPLPGGTGWWPQSVRLNGAPAPVMNRNQTPSVSVPQGDHRVTGDFSWNKMPEMIRVPPAVGLVDLRINGCRIHAPELDAQGRLWLQKRAGAAGLEDRLTLQLFRLLTDDIPMQVTTRVRLNVSGQAREVRFAGILPDNARPVRLESPLPAKLAPDGALVCQLRPGQWRISITTRSTGPVTQLTCGGGHGPEIWSFESRNHLRMVEITGAPSVEPERTDMPREWQRWPAYGMAPGSTLHIKEIRRGDPDPAPDRLALSRTWWLDFNGNGYTIQDTITGAMSRQWYLAMNPPGRLGRAAVDGKDRLITRQGPKNRPGVALRRGDLNLAADSRYTARTGRIPAVGWDHDFQEVSGILHLPPGWRLLAAGGVDTISSTWIQRWTLLDFFLVLIISLSIFKLRNWRWGLLALITMILIFHEPGAPRLVFLNIIAVLALRQHLPEGWVRKLVNAWGVGAVITLLVLAIPFMVQQIRWGVFPQLAPREGAVYSVSHDEMASVMPEKSMAPEPMEMDTSQTEYSRRDALKKSYLGAVKKKRLIRKQAVLTADPNALIQTGPGLPTWKWRSFRLNWNGPVERNQEVRLWLVSPIVNLVLGILRALLLAGLIVGLIDARFWWEKVNQNLAPGAAVAALALVLLIPGARNAHAAAFPPAELLTELQERLLEKPDCLPHCADILRMALALSPDRLEIRLQIHAATKTAIPLPATRTAWTPEAVLLDDRPLAGLSRDRAGMLWALVPEGIHNLVLTGTPVGDVLQIPLPLRPHLATSHSRGWTVRGIHPDGSTDAGIEITRTQPATAEKREIRNASLPAFFTIRRVFHLGLTWRVSTTIQRITPPGNPVRLSFPLLAEESVTTPGIHVAGTTAQIAIPPEVNTLRFESNLPMGDRLDLTAPAAVPWTETWVLDASPVWHCDFTGIPVIHHQDKRGHWQPEWSPWPGESVGIAISRPEAIPGQMVTIDTARLNWTPGLRFSKAGLSLTVRASRGGQHDIGLPEQANLQLVTLDGKSLPIRQKGRQITVPLQPGAQDIYVEWHQPAGSRAVFRAPGVDIGGESANAHITFEMPLNRWILLTGGPRLGPAVLFWSYLAVVAMAAWGLRKIGLTPLTYYQWLLLGLGLTQVSPLTALVVVGWLPALGLRKLKTPPDRWFPFNATQLVLIIWTIAALSGLYEAVVGGLLGTPDMQIAGNHSFRHLLQWTQDRVATTLPQPWVVTLPLWVYRVAMLSWSLWLAFSLLKWLQWGWRCYSTNGMWKKAAFRRFRRGEKKATPPALPGQTPPGGA